jgi:hypothetical protein
LRIEPHRARADEAIHLSPLEAADQLMVGDATIVLELLPTPPGVDGRAALSQVHLGAVAIDLGLVDPRRTG